MIGLGVSLLTVVRGLAPNIQTVRFGCPQGDLPLFLPPMWSTRNLRIALYLDIGRVDILIFDEHNYRLFLESKDATPIKEFRDIGGTTIQFEVPVRGKYYIFLRNRYINLVEGEVVLTFWGFERDLITMSVATLAFGFVLWTGGYLLKRRRESHTRS